MFNNNCKKVLFGNNTKDTIYQKIIQLRKKQVRKSSNSKVIKLLYPNPSNIGEVFDNFRVASNNL